MATPLLFALPSAQGDQTAVGVEVGTSLLPVLGIIALFAVIGFGLIYWVGRWARSDTDTSTPIGFTMSDLRELHESGEITDVEYRAARDSLIARIKQRSANQSKQPQYTEPKATRKNG